MRIELGALVVGSAMVLSAVQNDGAAGVPAVPAGHPRVYVRPGDLPGLKARIASPEFAGAWEQVRKAQGDPKHGYFYSAFVYLASGDKAAGRLAIEEGLRILKASKDARTFGMPFHLTALVYDWCYDLLDAGQKRQFIAEFERLAASHSPGYPADPRGAALVGHDQEGWLLTGQLPAGVAIYDESKTMYDAAAALFMRAYVPARNFHYRGHGHHQGDSYFSRFMYDLAASWLFRRMGAGDVLSREQQFVPYQIVYKLRPDGQQMRRGDTFDDSGRSDARKIEDSKRFCAQLAAYYYGDPYLLGVGESSLFNDLGAFEKVFELLFRPPGLRSRPLSDLPLTKYFPGPIGEMVARTGWQLGMDSRDAVVEMHAGEYFFGNHQRKDFGTFQIYYRGALAISSGYYDLYGTDQWRHYYHPTISHNGLLIFDPGEQGEVRDGGQRWPKGSDHPKDLETLLSPDYRMGQIVAHQSGPETQRPEYSYLAGDITGAYSQKVRLVTRSMATLRLPDPTYPAALVVFDRVESASAGFRKTWLLHSIQEPQVFGRRAEIVRDQDGYGGKLFVETLLPPKAEIRKVGGPGKEFWVESQGRNFPLSMKPRAGAEPGAWRIEVSPAIAAEADRFLHVMTVADAATGPAPVVRAIAAEGMTGAEVLGRGVLFGVAGNEIAQTRLAVPRGSRKKYLVCDLKPGLWEVRGPGKASRRMAVSAEGKCLYLDLEPGEHVLKLTQ